MYIYIYICLFVVYLHHGLDPETAINGVDTDDSVGGMF